MVAPALGVLLAACAAPATSPTKTVEVTLAPPFGDHAVLQRDKAVPVWGRAGAADAVTVTFHGQSVRTVAGPDGRWRVRIGPFAASSEPADLVVAGASTLTLHDVVVGEVWLCSGQSNMTVTLAESGTVAKDDVAASNDPQLRWFRPRNYMVTGDPYAGRTWSPTSPATAPGCSAAGFYFGRFLRQKLNVPIGILEVTFPGSAIETWMSPEALDKLGMGPEEKALTDEFTSLDTVTPKFLSKLDAWEKNFNRQDPGNKGFAQGWAEPKTNTSDWKSIPNLGDWSSLGLNNGGVVWTRKAIEFPAKAGGKEVGLVIGYLRNEGKEFGNILGTVYFNNHEVGTIGDVLRHIYTAPDETVIKVPGNLVVAGSNVIAVRFFTQKQKAPWNKTNLQVRMPEKTLQPKVTSDWLAKVEAELPPQPAEAVGSRPPTPPSPAQVRLPSIFFNQMLKPVAGYGIKGIFWWQGPANIEPSGSGVPSVLGNNPPEAYRKLQPALVSDWRQLWSQDDLPFYFVQEPGFGVPNAEPGKSPWATLRESQFLTLKTVPHTGMIVSIDLGDGSHHPPDKKPFGEREALMVLANTYGQKVDFSGPIYDSMAVEGDKIRLKFKYAGSGLTAKNGPLKEFAIAGADKHFVWADATVDGETVVVSSPAVASPVAVRYGWADNPTGCHLFNNAGLPASPFRTDDWPLQ